MPCHLVALAPQVVLVVLDKTLLTSGGHSVLAGDRNPKLFNVMCFNFDDLGQTSSVRLTCRRCVAGIEEPLKRDSKLAGIH